MQQSGLTRLARCQLLLLLITVLALIVSPTTKGSVSSGSELESLGPPTNTQESKPADVQDLKLRAPIEQELKGGEAHKYRVMLAVGQYLEVVVEQKGIDVVIKLFGPDGQKISEVDSPNGTQGPEPASLIASATGYYRLDVISPDKGVAGGRYEIRVGDLRESTAKDRDRIAARTTLAGTLTEARQLRAAGTAESLRKAIEKYNEALLLLQTVENRYDEARALNGLAVVFWLLGENQKALEYYVKALPLWRSVGDRLNEATGLHNIGTTYERLGDSQKALEYYDQALPLRRAVGDRNGEAITLNAIGLAYGHLGQLKEALDFLNQSMALRRATGDRKGEASNLISIASFYIELGELQKALQFSNEGLALVRATGPSPVEAVAINNLGVIYWELGEEKKALEYYSQALPLRRAVGDRPGEFSTLSNMGSVYQTLGEPEKALAYHNEALSLAQAMGDKRGEAATLQRIGAVHESSGAPQKALDFLNQALLLQRTLGDQLGEATTLTDIGASHYSLGRPEQALSYFTPALLLLQTAGDRSTEARTRQHIARAERDLGRLKQARVQIETALDIIERMRSQLNSQPSRTSFSASRQDYYKFYIDLLMRMHESQPSAGYDNDALGASERARARSLLEILAEGRADIRQGVDPALLERKRSTQQQLRLKSERLTRLLSGKHTDEQEKAASEEVEDLLTGYHGIEEQIRIKSPRYAALTQPQPLSSKEIQGLLDDETLLLEYSLGKERSYLWAVTPTSIKSFELPKEAEIEATARRFYELVTTLKNRELNTQAEAGAALSRMLLGPVADQLQRKRLVIVSEGALLYIPFAALPEPAVNNVRQVVSHKTTNSYQPLVVKHEIVSLPSASVLGLTRRELAGRLPAAQTVAVLADPVFRSDDPRIKPSVANPEKTPAEGLTRSAGSGHLKSDVERSAWESGVEDFQRLQHSREEAEAIVAQVQRKSVLLALDFTASRETAISEQLAQYRIVHFASHALLNNVHPELSGIVLSLVDETGRQEDGFVRLHEVYDLKLPVELVVLSGCRSALGKEVKGEGLVGLTRGFMYAGAARVVVSVWSVSDQATAELMKRFYREMLGKGLRPAAALRAAQVAMWKSRWWEAPYYWAGFVLQGEWR
jgi:CHAT domain-containing protein/tetratricopeptide (TPR) repeat protein